MVGATIVFTVFVGYFLPGIVAFLRHRPNAVSILLLNVLLGWTLVGWVVALVWATTTAKS